MPTTHAGTFVAVLTPMNHKIQMRNVLLWAVIGSMTVVSGPAFSHPPKKTDTHVKHAAAPDDNHSFAMHMAQHHRDGVAMADVVIANGTSDDVRAIARRIKTDQQKDIATLEAHKGDQTAKKMSLPPKDPDMEKGMAQLKAAKGAEADRLFLELMITHHASGLVMAHGATPHLSDTELKDMATDMFAKQAREIGELQRLRESNRSAQK